MRFYHNPRCSKSRQALALLEERGVDVIVIRYLETGVDEADLPIIAQLEHVVRKKSWSRSDGEPQRPKGCDGPVAEQSARLERPILIVDGQAVIGRPPENVLSLLKPA